jgi:CubicO group peptidase (beta-lactamase class C family)
LTTTTPENLKETRRGAIFGRCDARFEGVLEAFARNFDELGELGAAVAITHEGETAVDLWGGLADEKTARAWDEDTITCVYSATKGAAATLVHLLAERGLLDLDAPVTEHWPEYAGEGKGATTLAMMLDHTAGVPALRAPMKPKGALDWDYMAERIAAEAPFFEPGTRSAYHALTFAWTVGETVRRANGRTLGDLFRTEIAEPLGLDFHIGVRAEDADDVEARFAPIRAPKLRLGTAPPPELKTILSEPGSIPALAFLNNGGLNQNQPETHRAEIPATGGLTNARGLAGLYRPLALGEGLLRRETTRRMARVSSATHFDATLQTGTRFGLGVMRSIDNRRNAFRGDSAILGEHAFGHVGSGGSIGFADPDAGMSFGYAMNQQGLGVMLNERGQGLVDAAYRALGYRTNESGAWTH